MKRVAAILGIALALATFVAAQARPWAEVQSPHFDVYCDCDAAAATSLAKRMERVRQLFHQLVAGSGRSAPQPLEIVAVRNWEEFRALEPAEFTSQVRKSRCIYQPTEFLDFILLCLDAGAGPGLWGPRPGRASSGSLGAAERGPAPINDALNGPDGAAAIDHEYAHYLADHEPFPMPPWLNEGLAELLQTARLEGADADVGRDDSLASRLLHAPRRIPLQQLFAVGLDSPYHFDQNKRSMFYPESWAVVRYLLLRDLRDHSHRLNDYWTRVKGGADPTAAAVASFGDLDALQKAVVVSLHPWNLHDAQVHLPAAAPPAAFRAIPLTGVDSEALEASVLAHGRRYAAADARAQSILRRDPANALAEQVRGLVAFRRHEYSDAQRWLQRAVKANPAGVTAAVLLAEATLHAGGASPVTAAALLPPLQNATRMRPDFAPAFDLLAQVKAILPQGLTAAMAAEARAIALAPREWTYRWNAATLQFNAGNLKAAIRLFRAAERRTGSLARIRQCREAILQAQGQLELQAQVARHNAAAPVPAEPPLRSHSASLVPLPPAAPLVIRGRVEYEACPSGTIDSLWLDLSSHGVRLHFSAGRQFSWRGMVMPGQTFDPCRDMRGREVIVQAQNGEMSFLDVLGVAAAQPR